MRKWFHNLRVAQKLMLISIFFMMPDSFMLYMFITGINSNIQFADLEKKGNRYQRPLEQLLELVPEHQALVQAAHNGNPQAADALPKKQAEIETAFDSLISVDSQIGPELQFTEDGLAKRSRQRCHAGLVRAEWEELKGKIWQLDNQDSNARHLQIVADVRTMITHAGDMSNLILDPDLDSYYLMDVTLLALPQTQDRLARMMADGEAFIRQNKQSLDLSGTINATLLKEADLDRIVSSTGTALNEDENFYGVSPSLQKRVPPALQAYLDATQNFIALTNRLGNKDNPVTVDEYLAAGNQARDASFNLGRISDEEVDVLLQNRIDYYDYRRFKSLTVAFFALIAAITLVTFITRSISGPLKQQALDLKSTNEALQAAQENLEDRVRERTQALQLEIQERKDAEAKLDATHRQLVEASRQAGKAEVATGVLHNVGNVLNSVNVSATVVADKLRQSELASLSKAGQLIRANKEHLADFLTTDERGKLLPDFLVDLADCLQKEQEFILEEVSCLSKGVEHIKEVITSQQSLARSSTVLSPSEPAKLFDSAVTMLGGSLERHGIEIIRQYEETEPILIDKHKVLQILINLIGNAKQAVKEGDNGTNRITLVMQTFQNRDNKQLRFQVIDTGMGIAPENLTRIFSHGFTTKQEGHGFGLHSAANAAKEMGGSLTASSEGPGHGATFTLDLPINAKRADQTCKS